MTQPTADDWVVFNLERVKTQDALPPLADTLDAVKELTPPPTELQVTVKHHGFTYQAWCYSSGIYLSYDPDVPSNLRIKSQSCGHLMRPFVGKRVPHWIFTSKPPPDGFLVGTDITGGFLTLHKAPDRYPPAGEDFIETYMICSLNLAKP